MTPHLPDARPGDPVLPAMQALVRYERAEQLATGRNTRRRVMPFGTSYSVDASAAPWAHPFKVTVAGSEATVRAGLIESITPTIEGVSLKAETQPKVKITGQPNAESESWIALLVTVNPELERIDLAAEFPAIIIHTNDWTKLETETLGAIPLALLEWKDRAVSKVTPHVMHNLRHFYRARSGTKPARHYFTAI